LLNANVAFLSIPSVDSGFNVLSRTPAQLASYFSIVTSVGAVVLGLLLSRQTHTKRRDSPREAVSIFLLFTCHFFLKLNVAQSAFMVRMTHATFGLEPLAIMYSLPYALLMWG
jgi:hypothetical protein